MPGGGAMGRARPPQLVSQQATDQWAADVSEPEDDVKVRRAHQGCSLDEDERVHGPGRARVDSENFDAQFWAVSTSDACLRPLAPTTTAMFVTPRGPRL